MKAEQTLVQTHPEILKILGSKNPGYVALAVIPILIYFTINLSRSDISLATGIMLFGLGVIYWTFLEYCIHRWLYHIPVKSIKIRNFLDTFHMYHHRNLEDRRVLNAGPLMIYPMAFFVLLPIFFLLGQKFDSLCAFGLGTLMAYFWYEIVHFAIHYKKFNRGYFSYIQRFHFYHHEKAWNKNMGNTSHFWDVLLGTYDDGYERYDLSNKAKSSLITSSNQD